MTIRKRHFLILGCTCAVVHLGGANAQDAPEPPRFERAPTVVAPPGTRELRRAGPERSPFEVVRERDLPPIDDDPGEVQSIDAEIVPFEVGPGEERVEPAVSDDGATTAEDDLALLERVREETSRLDGDDPLERFLFTRHVHGPAPDVARRLAPGAIDLARETLANPELVDYHPNALALIAFGREDGAEELILDYLLAPFAVEPFRGFSAKAAAVLSLGWLAAETGGDQGLDFLLRTSDPDGWYETALPWLAPGVEDTPRELAILSVSALSLSGTPAAREVLLELAGGSEEELVRRGLERGDVLAFLERHGRNAR